MVVEELPLGCVVQAPGRADRAPGEAREDERDGFSYGGWASRLHTELEPIRTQAFANGAVVARYRVVGRDR